MSELAYVKLMRFDAVSTIRSVMTFIAIMAILFVFYAIAFVSASNSGIADRFVLVLIIAGAILFRLTLLFVGLPAHATLKEATLRLQSDVSGRAVTFDSYLLYDNDIWRYLWDGHVSAAGMNPYLFAPGSHELDGLAVPTDQSAFWSDIRANVNYADVPTVYAPFAQLLFRIAHAIAPGSIFTIKLLLIMCDLVTIIFVSLTLSALNRPPATVLLYAWNPLVIKVIAGSGHVDAVLAMLIAGLVYFVVRSLHLAAAVTWGLATLVKICPIVLLPFLIRRVGWRRSTIGILVIAVGYAPYLHPPSAPFVGLQMFATEWQFNSGFFTLIESLAPRFSMEGIATAQLLSTLIFLSFMTLLVVKDGGTSRGIAHLSAAALGSMVILSPTVMPWYLVWVLPAAVVAGSYAWVSFSGAVCLAFLAMIDGKERSWMLAAEFLFFVVMHWCARWWWPSEREEHETLQVSLAEGTRDSAVQGERPWPA